MIKTSDEYRYETRSDMRGGNGDITLVHMLEKDETAGKARLVAHLLLPVGGSIGGHTHDPDAEIFIVVSGSALLDDNGALTTLNAGDVAYTSAGESHSVTNTGDTELDIIAIVIE